MPITYSSPLLAAIEEIDRAATFAWSANNPTSAYHEKNLVKQYKYMADLDKACEEYLKLRR